MDFGTAIVRDQDDVEEVEESEVQRGAEESAHAGSGEACPSLQGGDVVLRDAEAARELTLGESAGAAHLGQARCADLEAERRRRRR